MKYYVEYNRDNCHSEIAVCDSVEKAEMFIAGVQAGGTVCGEGVSGMVIAVEDERENVYVYMDHAETMLENGYNTFTAYLESKGIKR